MRLSIIISVYNAEKYIVRCIESIIFQLLEGDELILVDDGSVDNSGVICDKYQEKYLNVIAVHQDNKGAGAARNTGIKVANGDYIIFMDSDDFADEKMVECVRSYSNKGYDIILFEYIVEDSSKRKKQYNLVNVKLHEFSKESSKQFLKSNFLARDIVEGCNFNMRSVWAKAYRRKFILNNELYFDEDVKIGEDMLYLIKVYSLFENAACVEVPIYHYFFQNEESITNCYKPDLEKMINSYISAINPWLKENAEYIPYHANYRLNDMILYIKYDFFHKENKEENKILKNEMKRILVDGIYQEYYKIAKDNGLISSYGIAKRITFWVALHGYFCCLRWIAFIRY